MIVGRENLKKMFPNFAEDVQENGIDLRVGEVYEISEDYNNRIVGCVNNMKYLPQLKKINPSLTTNLQMINDENKCKSYKLLPRKFYFIKIDREMEIPDGYCQSYFIRSTFTRCGLLLMDSWGDNGFEGTLMMGLYNTNKNMPIIIGENERIIQAVTYENDGTASQYGGSYQNNKIYGK